MKKASGWQVPIILILTAVLLAGCSGFSVINGSGSIITKSYDFSKFTDIEISSAFNFEVTPSNTFSVSITSYENLFNYFNVSQSGNTLKIGMKSGYFTRSYPDAKIGLPVLTRLNVSGASHGSATGFVSAQNFSVELSGAGTLTLGMEAGNTDLSVSGAGKISGQLKAQDSHLDLSGASRAELTGSANNLTLNVSGASTASLPDFSLQNSTANISGASTANLNVNRELSVEVSGASTLNYTGNPTLGKISVTGASSLNHK
jgi:hypothetical protein